MYICLQFLDYDMDYTIYKNSLGLALTLMIFFAIYFFVAKTAEKPIFSNYKRSRRIMGAALLVLAANYSVHLFCGLRFKSQDAAILMNLSTYFLSYWLFAAAMVTLLNRFFITVRRFIRNIIFWIVFTALACVVLFGLPHGGMDRMVGIAVLAVCLFSYGIYLSWRIIRTYHHAVRLFDDTHSENIAAYIRWMSIFTWWAVIYGVSCGLLTFLPDEYVFLWILSSVPFYIYLYCSYMNYLLFYEQVETILEIPEEKEETVNDTPTYYSAIEKNLAVWLSQNGFTSPGLTIEDLALTIGTNRTYLSAYINKTYALTFREWIANLRIDYAKQLFRANPKMSVGEVCEATGFLSQSYFVKIFSDREGLSPAKWKREVCSISKQ